MTASTQIRTAARQLAAQHEAEGFTTEQAREMATATVWAGIVAGDPAAARQLLAGFAQQ